MPAFPGSMTLPSSMRASGVVVTSTSLVSSKGKAVARLPKLSNTTRR